MSGMPTECQFIYMGMTKEGWKHLTPETIRGYLDDPSRMDDEHQEWNESFFVYHGWYWDNQRSK